MSILDLVLLMLCLCWRGLGWRLLRRRRVEVCIVGEREGRVGAGLLGGLSIPLYHGSLWQGWDGIGGYPFAMVAILVCLCSVNATVLKGRRLRD